MSEWPYPYCPHQAFNKNQQIRLASIPYTFVPDPTIDAFTNLNVKCANLTKRNISTLAYESYFTSGNQIHSETNFAKDFYLASKDTNAVKYDNKIVQEMGQQLSKRNAYVLASQATVEYQKFEQKRKNALENARRRANSAWIQDKNNKKQKKAQDIIENTQWLKKLYKKLQQVAKHIVNGQGQDNQQKQRNFLLSKSSLTANYLSQIKVRNPKSAFQILQQLRILLMKKKLKFQNQRQEQEKNKSVSMSYTSQASQNTSQGSMLSQATSVNQSNISGEQKILSQYCDFDILAKKWGLQNVNDVKSMLRLILTKSFVSKAQLQAVKKRKQAEKINQQIIKLNPKLSKQKQNKSKIKKQTKSKIKKKQDTQILQTPKKLNKQEQIVKEKLLSGGQFDATGQKFSRNRLYSQLFDKKQKQIKYQYKVMQKNNQQQPISKAQKEGKPLNSTLNLSK